MSKVKNLQILLNYDISRKVKIVKKLKKYIGYSLTRRALFFFVKIKKYVWELWKEKELNILIG